VDRDVPAPNGSFTHSHRVRYHETDTQGYLFNSRYLEIADVAMTEFFRALGWPYDRLIASGVDPSVVSAQLTFRAPARFDDVVDVQVRCVRVGDSSFELHHTLTRGDTELAEISIVYVNVDIELGKSRPLTAAVAAALTTAGPPAAPTDR
jgi:acyl-CoA thioester hydrolase